jgi:integrase
MLVKDVSSLAIQRATLQWLRQKVKPATINRRLYVIRQTLKQAVLHRYINTLPTITNLSERGNERQGFFTREEFQRLYRELPEYARDMCLFAYITGWRKSEITGLQWSAMRWDTMVLLLPKTKNGEQRIFPVVMPEMVALMQRCYEQRNGGLIFHRDGEPLGDFKRAWK